MKTLLVIMVVAFGVVALSGVAAIFFAPLWYEKAWGGLNLLWASLLIWWATVLWKWVEGDSL